MAPLRDGAAGLEIATCRNYCAICFARPTAVKTSRSHRSRRSHAQSSARGAFVVDDEDGICKLITMTLATMGVASEKFHTAPDAVAALDGGLPAIIFLDVALKKSDAIDVIRGLGERGYRGIVQLMSGSNVELLEDVRRIGARHGLIMRPPLTKPFRAESIRHVIREAQLADSPLAVVALDEALAKGWLELWYQPKIDLRAQDARRRRRAGPLPSSGRTACSLRRASCPARPRAARRR